MQRVYEENEWGKVSKRIITLSILAFILWLSKWGSIKYT